MDYRCGPLNVVSCCLKRTSASASPARSIRSSITSCAGVDARTRGDASGRPRTAATLAPHTGRRRSPAHSAHQRAAHSGRCASSVAPAVGSAVCGVGLGGVLRCA
eukprot:5015225-Prymnesium_polylepis.1